MNIDEIEKKLRQEIEAALEEGYGLRTGSIYLNESGQACALGMLTRDVDGLGLYSAAAEMLGITMPQVGQIAFGFDKPDLVAEEFASELTKLGARLRRDYFETTEVG